MTTSKRAKRRPDGAGSVRVLASGKWQARHRGDDGEMRPAPLTFETKQDAIAWLNRQTLDVKRGTWEPPSKSEARGSMTLENYAADWLDTRKGDLTPRTWQLYRDQIKKIIVPDLGATALDRLTSTTVRRWYSQLDPEKPTRRANAYTLLRTILNTAVDDDLIPSNPCKVRGAGVKKRAHTIRVATLDELARLEAAMPARLRALVTLAAWCSLRQGELLELRRKDIDVERGAISVDRGVTRGDGQVFVGKPKSEAGIRRVIVPPHVLPTIAEHLERHVASGPDSLLFPSGTDAAKHLPVASLYDAYYAAREAVGRPELRLHDLRHTGNTLYAEAGASIKEQMQRAGHATPAMALLYTHVAEDRQRVHAQQLSELAKGPAAGKT